MSLTRKPCGVTNRDMGNTNSTPADLFESLLPTVTYPSVRFAGLTASQRRTFENEIFPGCTSDHFLKVVASKVGDRARSTDVAVKVLVRSTNEVVKQYKVTARGKLTRHGAESWGW